MQGLRKRCVVSHIGNIESRAQQLTPVILAGMYMAKRHRNLITRIADIGNLRAAYEKASRGRRQSSGYLNFKEYDSAWLQQLHETLLDGSYLAGTPREFWVYEPKPRLISALPFRDRVVQHAIVAVIGPIFEAGMMPQSYACRKGRGMHSGAIKTQQLMRKISQSGRPVYALKTDFSKYFHSIDRAVLWQQIRRKISCRATLSLLEIFTPHSGTGMPIGNLTSQLWANVYGTLVDRFLCQTLKMKHFVRYMDDIVILHNNRDVLRGVFDFLELYVSYRLKLRFSHWSIRPVSLGVNFLGYRIFNSYKLLRKQSVVRAKRKIKKHIKTRDHAALKRFAGSWLGHAQWADSHNLIRHLRQYARNSYVCTTE